MDIEDVHATLVARLSTLQAAAVEAQVCIPDIIISIMSGKDRLAYVRLPIVDYTWSKNPDECGPQFGKAQTFMLKSMKVARPAPAQRRRPSTGRR